MKNYSQRNFRSCRKTSPASRISIYWWMDLTVLFGSLFLAVPLAVGQEQQGGGPIVGIDLGTTYSCVGVYKDGNVKIIPNDQGNRITPSYVAFSDKNNERLVGDAAKNHATINPENTVYDVKRLIGRSFTDVQAGKKLVSFQIVSEDSKPRIGVTQNGEQVTFAPEEISAMMLGKMKATAESFLGEPVTRAVVTVPAYFTDEQRQATKDAGIIAGLKVEQIINEPTAAAIAYGMDREIQDSNIIVFHLGGATFDVTLFNIDDGAFEVLATHGDTHLGGDDFDQRVIQYYIKKMAKTDRLDISKDNHALQKLRKEVERVKRILSSQSQARLEIEDLVPGYNLSETLTRARFEGLNEDLFTKTMDPIKHVLERANLNESDIDQIVLVGGSSRIPKVRQLVSAFFNGKEISKGINPDEAVAYGAAVQGAILRSLTQDEEDAGRDRTFTIVGLSEAEIDLLIQEAKGFAEEDRLESRNGLDLYLYNLKKSLNGAVGASDGVVSAIGKNKLLENLVDETLDWMEENAAGATKHKLDRKHKEVEQVANPVMGNLYFSGGGSGPEDEEDSYDNDL